MKFAIALVAAFAVAEANQYRSGAVTGFEKFTYGKFITRMKAPNQKGTVSSFFTYWNGPDFYPGGWNELDMEIVPSVEQNPFSMNVIYGDGKTKRESHDYMSSFDPKDDWHIYEMAWTPDFIAYSIDNKEVRRITKDDPSVKLTSKPQSVMMNFWTPTFESWGKGLDAKDMPWYAMYDYVETYTYNHETKTFDFNWRDSFNTFDTSRWHKSDNTTFDANSTTFRASQAYIENGNLVLKMEPDAHETRHGIHAFEPTRVETVRTEPTPEHMVQKGQKPKKADEHYDVGAEQHYSHMKREVHHEEPFRYGYEPAYGADPYAAPHYPLDPYAAGPVHEPAYMDPYARHDPYAAYPRYPYENPYAADVHSHEPTAHDYYPDPYHHDPYHHQQPPKTKAEAEQHMGPEAALFYKEMHNKQKQQQQQQQPKPAPAQQTGKKSSKQNDTANYTTEYRVDHEETPYEHAHAHEAPHMRELVHGYEHHPDAHFEQGYWDLKDHVPHLGDEGHFAGEEHGEYHYIEPERDHHLGHYYSYRDDREHHPQHVDQHHDSHGIEHKPDDWRHDTETHYRHHDEYVYRPEHSYEGDFQLEHVSDHHLGGEDFVHGRHDEAHDIHEGDGYNHDVEKHEGTGMMRTIEHEFDQLFHDLEDSTRHGVEHHDLHYTTIHGKEQAHQEHPREEADFHAQPYHHEQRYVDVPYEHDVYTGHHQVDHRDEQHRYERQHETSTTTAKKQTSSDDKKTQKQTQKHDQKSKKNYSEEGSHHYEPAVHDYVRQILSTASFTQ